MGVAGWRGGLKWEVAGWKLEVWKLEVGSWKLEVESWKFEFWMLVVGGCGM